MKIIEQDYRWHGGLTKREHTDLIVLHHAAASSCTAMDVHSWHVANGWVGIGYHFFVRKDGSIYRGRPEHCVGAHAYGANYKSIGICFEGNFMTETMPDAQIKAGAELVKYLKNKWGISWVAKHKDIGTTDCPGKYFPFDKIAHGCTEEIKNEGAEKVMVETIEIGNGDRGNAVKTLQGALIAQGYAMPKYGADGVCGAETVSAIRSFQSAHGLKADGICGKNTWGALLRG